MFFRTKVAFSNFEGIACEVIRKVFLLTFVHRYTGSILFMFVVHKHVAVAIIGVVKRIIAAYKICSDAVIVEIDGSIDVESVFVVVVEGIGIGLLGRCKKR